MLPRPRFRIPLTVAVLLAVALYAARSALRGFDWRLDLPVDAVVLVAFILVLGVVAYVRRSEADADEKSDSTDAARPDQPTAGRHPAE